MPNCLSYTVKVRLRLRRRPTPHRYLYYPLTTSPLTPRSSETFVNMSNANSFNEILQETVTPDDDKWEYTIPHLPKSRSTRQASLIKCVSVVSSIHRQQITLRFAAVPWNRVTRSNDLDKLLLISFADFKLHWPAPATGQDLRPATARENGTWITKMLVSGITINGATYHFFGHSNSQLKSRSCFMYAASKQELSIKVEAMGDLSKIKSVGKKAKRIGLLFSSAEVTLDLSPDRCQDIDDVATKDYIFTDGFHCPYDDQS